MASLVSKHRHTEQAPVVAGKRRSTTDAASCQGRTTHYPGKCKINHETRETHEKRNELRAGQKLT
jgi:hypothetical protein